MNKYQAQELAKGHKLYRIHREDTPPELFTSHTSRFDDIDNTPPQYLTNYFSDNPLGCFAEVFGRHEFLYFSLILEYRISEVSISKDIALAEIDHPFNLGNHNMEASHYSCTDYKRSREFAQKVFDEGEHDGVDHPLRYTMKLQIRGQTIFSEKEYNLNLIRTIDTMPIPNELINLASSVFGLTTKRVH